MKGMPSSELLPAMNLMGASLGVGCQFCHVTAGRVRISDAYGRSKEFGPGASFVIPSGFEGEWHVLEPMKKFYAIFEQA